MLNLLSTKKPSIYKTFVKDTGLFLVDEAHYEPAVKWSKVVRDIKAPKIIFTATPFRNDFLLFEVDTKFSFAISYISMYKKKILRQLHIINRSNEVTNNPTKFVEDVIDFYDSRFDDKESYAPRVIIRCDERNSIIQLANELEERGKKVIAIHEFFKKSQNRTKSWMHKSVPQKGENIDAVYWIHQFKLIEGIDDSRFQILAIYEPFTNARALIQQIGRILRNPKQEKGIKEEAYLLDHSNFQHSEMWKGFVEYDKIVDERGSVFNITQISLEDILEKYIMRMPPITYIKGKFRIPLRLDDSFDPMVHIQLPLKTNLIKKLSNFNLKTLTKIMLNTYKKKRIAKLYKISNDLSVIVLIRFNNSPYLVHHFYLESLIHVTIVKEFANFVSVFDSSGMNWLFATGLGYSINSDQLKKLFNSSAQAYLTSVSLKNSNIGSSSIRSQTITATSIDNTAPNFNDYAQICTTAQGYSSLYLKDKNIKRYVGFSRGRISEQLVGFYNLPIYLSWLNFVKNVVESDRESILTFSRYALSSKIDLNTEPRNILLDVEDLEIKYHLKINNKVLDVFFEDKCYNVKNSKFKIKVSGYEFPAKISYNGSRYILECSKLEAKCRRIENETTVHKNIVKQINHSQSFRVLPKDLSVVYVMGEFYNPKFKIGKDFNPDYYNLKSSFIIDDRIGKCSEEKGIKDYYKQPKKDWDPDSLFGIISRCAKGEDCGASEETKDLFGNPDYIICDDMQTEIADFILCDLSKPRIIIIHAKAGKAKYSASKLQDICGQATKNLGLFSMYNDFTPPNLKLWMGPWESKNKIKVENRIVKKPDNISDVEQVWKQIRELINDPIADKEVWLFLGNLLCKDFLEDQLKIDDPEPEVVQCVYMLHGVMTAVASQGAKLRIFCKSCVKE